MMRVLTCLCFAVLLAGQVYGEVGEDGLQVQRGGQGGHQVLFTSNHDGDLDIYVADTAMGSVNKLTDNDRDDIHAVWSPDGSRIAFSSSARGDYEICVVNADGTGFKQLTDNDELDQKPVWRADGTGIAYINNKAMAARLMLYDMATGKHRVLVEAGDIKLPQFSPSGGMLAFMVPDEKNNKYRRLQVLDLATGEVRRVNGDLNIVDYTWSTDSERFAVTARAKRANNVYLLALDGTVEKTLTQRPLADYNPVWIEGDKALAFLSTDEKLVAQVSRLDLSSGEVTYLKPSPLPVEGLKASSDQRYLTWTRFENRAYHSQLLDLESQEQLRVAPDVGGTHIMPRVRPVAVAAQSLAFIGAGQ